MSKTNGWVKFCAVCLFLICAAILWEVGSGIVWSYQFDSLVEEKWKEESSDWQFKSFLEAQQYAIGLGVAAETGGGYMPTLKELPQPTHDKIEKELREQGNPYSLFK